MSPPAANLNPPHSPTAESAWDIVVVGAGPAGSATAIRMARAGFSVMIVDSREFPRRKVCGGCLNQKSLQLLRDLVGDGSSIWKQAVELRAFRLLHQHKEFNFDTPEGYAVDRALLDDELVRVAQQAGAVFESGTRASLVPLRANRGCESVRTLQLHARDRKWEVQAKVVVWAAGLGSRPNNQEFQNEIRPSSRVGIEAILSEFPDEYNDATIHMAVGREGYVGLTQICNNRLHIAAAVDRSALQAWGPAEITHRILTECGAVQIPFDPETQWQGTQPLTTSAKVLATERVFLVGDAAGYVEPFTGEGIRWALQSSANLSPILVDAVHDWSAEHSERWQVTYRKSVAKEQILCRLICGGIKYASSRWLAHQVLKIHPKIAQRVIKRLNGVAA